MPSACRRIEGNSVGIRREQDLNSGSAAADALQQRSSEISMRVSMIAPL